MNDLLRPSALVGLTVAALAMPPSPARAAFVQTNLVSDVPGFAQITDPNLRNPWGISYSGTSPFWISNQGANNAELYNALPTINQVILGTPPNTVTAPMIQTAGNGPPTGPTGQVNNSTASDFMIPAPGGTTVKSSFLFDTLDGTIQDGTRARTAAWAPRRSW